jgi:hypothetical protein
MKTLFIILTAAFLSGCSCAITPFTYSPVKRQPSTEVIDKLATDAGFMLEHQKADQLSYSKGVLGMHFTRTSGDIEFVNSHCPILPFWIEPGRTFEKRWEDMKLMIEKLSDDGFPYRLNPLADKSSLRTAH